MAGRGPLPKANARRVNPPTIPTTALPAAGRADEPPECPYDLGKAGSTWWEWAWRTPQAAAWDDGALYFVARRAQLEDELAKVEFLDSVELHDLLAGADDEAVRNVEFALSTLKRAAGGSTTLKREMRELDNRLGLNPKAMSELRWTIVPTEAEAEQAEPNPEPVVQLRAV